MKQLENKVAIVTGGASGIGKAIVELFVKEGAKVLIADLNEDSGTKLANSLGQATVFVKADSSSPEDNKKLVDIAVEKFGALHIAVIMQVLAVMQLQLEIMVLKVGKKSLILT